MDQDGPSHGQGGSSHEGEAEVVESKAGEGNRTLVSWLGTKRSAIELHRMAAGRLLQPRSVRNSSILSSNELPRKRPVSDCRALFGGKARERPFELQN